MSKMKSYLEDQIQNLANETGYSFNFLFDIWCEECEDGEGDFEYFCGVTRELDW